jgi:hypothetical protein
MLWLAQRLKVDDRKLTLAKFKCANQVRHLMKDQRSLDALDAAEKYGNGEISSDELNAAYASASSSSAASDAASAAAYASASSSAASDAASAAAYAAAYATAYAAAYVAARKESMKRSANFCREILTEEVLTAYAKLR